MLSKLVIYTILGLVVGTVPTAGFSYLQISNTQGNLDTTKSALEKTAQDNLSLKNQLDEANKKFSNLQSDLAARNTELASKSQRIESLDRTIEQMEAKRATLEAQVSDQKASIAKLDAQLFELKASSVKLEAEKSDLQKQIGSLSSQIAPLQQSISSLQADKTNLQQQLTSNSNQITSLTAERNSLQTRINDLQTQASQLQGQISTLTAERNNLRRNFDALNDKWKLWTTHSELAPQRRDSVEYFGYIPSAGGYNIDKTSILISFTNPTKCLQVSRILGTSSMRPAFDAGHQLIVNTCFLKDDFRPGDIITYSNSLGNVVHQIVEVRSQGMITKGIHNEVSDPLLVRWEEITGLVVAIIF